MFFRREQPRVPAFDERLATLRAAGFTVTPEPGGGVRVTRAGCGAVVIEDPDGHPRLGPAGWLVGAELGLLVDLGYQKAWQTPDGRREAALAAQLKTLHAFEEDLRAALGVTSLYNQSLGTTNDLHLYDRVAGRDRGARRPWNR